MEDTGGLFGLQDFNENVQIVFRQNYMGRVSKFHNQLFSRERELKRNLVGHTSPKVNILLATVSVKFVNSEAFSQYVVMENDKVLAFHSASDTAHLESKCPEYNFSHSCVPELQSVVNNNEVSVVRRGKHDGINRKKFNALRGELEEIRESIRITESHLSISARMYVQKIAFPADISATLDEMQDDMMTQLLIIKSKKKEYKNKYFVDFIGNFWHSEPRILNYFYNDNTFLNYLSEIAKAANQGADLVLLQLHSTHNVCDNCRLQLTGAVHKWLYKKIIDIFSHNCVPIFHVVVSWSDDPRTPILCTNTNNEGILNIDNVATIEALGHPLSKDTNPYVSFVRLEPESENK